jgi:riboflavin kinase / FMN adenylyltransferase
VKTYASLGELPVGDRRRAVAIGTFDGVHLGHREIIAQARAHGHARGIPVMVMTFEPHPIDVLRPELKTTVLTPVDLKSELIASCEVDELLIVSFTQAFARIRADRFVEMIASPPLGAEVVVVGQNFRFGSGGTGTADRMRAYGRARGVEVIAPGIIVSPDGKPISSTRIRRLIGEGRLDEAAVLLGRPHIVEGMVVAGDQRGRTLGLPTANIEPIPYAAIPGKGVYAGRATTRHGQVTAAINIGVAPTFRVGHERDPLRIEAFLLDYDGPEFYGEPIRVEFVTRLRDEQRFADAGDLVAQIHIDIARTRELVATPANGVLGR